MKDTFFKTRNKSITFSPPTNDFRIILDKTIRLFDKNFDGKPLRLVGVTLQNLVDPHDVTIQMTFFDYQKHEEESTTKLLINELNRQMNKPLLKRASEASKPKGSKNGNKRRD